MNNEIITLDSTIKVDSMLLSEVKNLDLKILTIFCPQESILPIINAAVKRGIPHERFSDNGTGVRLFA